MPHASRPRRLLALATASWPARGYLALVAAAALGTALFPDAGLLVDPALLTAPLSFAVVVLPVGPGSATAGAAGVLAGVLWVLWLLLCAVVNAAVLGALVPGGTPAARATPGAGSAPLRLRAVLTPAVDNWPARAYLALVAAALGFFLYAAYLSPDPGFAAVWPTLATAPLGFAALLATVPAADSPWLAPLLFTTGTAASGLLNAVLLGHLTRRARPSTARA